MTDRPLYKELRRVFLDSWSDANGWASMLRVIADRQETDPRPRPAAAGGGRMSLNEFGVLAVAYVVVCLLSLWVASRILP